MKATGWGAVQTVPIALEAVDFVMGSTNCAAGDRLSGATLAKIFAGVVTDWHAVDPVTCPVGTTINVAARSDSCSGTTKAVKNFFFKKDPADYAAAEVEHSCDTAWPPGSGIACTGSTDAAMANCARKGAGLITYVDASAASAIAPGLVVLPVDNGANAFSIYSAGSCTAAAATAPIPPSTAADWADVSATDQPTGYGVCFYVYELAPAAASADRARCFIGYEVSDEGQAVLVNNGFDPLPADAQVIAQGGAQTL